MSDAPGPVMGNAFRIGRVFGIELRIDPSWLVIFALVSWSLTSLFSQWHPDWPLATSVLVAVTASLFFFGSVLFHELAHSLVARLYGIPVRDITLHLFGGVSNIEKEPPTPRAELLIAIVGPIASVGLGMAMVLASAMLINLRAPDVEAAADVVSRLGPFSTLLVWLGPVNIIVGLFNMIPGFPLDGGRILRAIVWRITGSLHTATRIAGASGRTVGWLFVILGVAMAFGYRVPFFGRGLTSGLWLGLIGLFLRNAAIAHLRGAVIDEALLGVHVADLMRTTGGYVDANLSVRSLVEDWFMRHEEAAYPVFDNGVFVGIVTFDDVRRVAAVDGWTSTVRDLMTPAPRLVSAAANEDLSSALRKLGTSGVRQLPVLDRGALVGMLYEKDIARWLELRGRVMESHTAHVRHA